MSTLRLTVAVTLILSLGPSPSRAADLESILPADTGIVIAVPDVPAFRAHWKAGLPGALWADPALTPLTASLEESLEVGGLAPILRSLTGRPLEETVALMTGSAAVALPGIPLPGADGSLPPLSFGLLIEVRDPDVLETLVAGELAKHREHAKQGETVSVRTERAAAVTLHRIERQDETGNTDLGGWAAVDGILIRATPSEYLRRLVARASGSETSPGLGAEAAFRAVRDRAPEADQVAFVNLARILPPLQAGVTEAMDHDLQNDPKVAALGITAAGIFQALALDVLETGWFTLTLGETESRAETGLTYSEERGLIALLASTTGPCPRPEFIGADVLGMSVSSFSIERFWNGLLELAEGVSPGAGVLLRTQAQQLGMASGLDFERDILAQFGASTFSLFVPGDPDAALEAGFGLSQITGVEIRDRAALEQNLTLLMAGLSGGTDLFETREVPGGTVHLMPALSPDTSARFSYALTDRYLLFGSGPEMFLADVIADMQDPGPSIWERPDLRAPLAAIPADAAGVLFYDLARMMDTVLPALSRHGEESLPDLAGISRHLGPLIGGSVRSEGMLVTSYRMFHPRP